MGNFLSTAIGQGSYQDPAEETEYLNTNRIPQEIKDKVSIIEKLEYEKRVSAEKILSEKLARLKVGNFKVNPPASPITLKVKQIEPVGATKETLKAELLQILNDSELENLNANLEKIVDSYVETISKKSSEEVPTYEELLIEDKLPKEVYLTLYKRLLENADQELESLRVNASLPKSTYEYLSFIVHEIANTDLEKLTIGDVNASESTLEELNTEDVNTSESTLEELSTGEVNTSESTLEELSTGEVNASESTIQTLKYESSSSDSDTIINTKFESPAFTNFIKIVTPILSTAHYGLNPEMSILDADTSLRSVASSKDSILEIVNDASRITNVANLTSTEFGVLIDTLSKRFGYSTYLSTITEFTGYISLATQILNAVGNGTVTTENLVFASTFWYYYYTPLSLNAPTTRDRGLTNSNSTIVKAQDTLNQLIKSSKKKVNDSYDDYSFYNLADPESITFKGRSSIVGIELFNKSRWDITFKRIEGITSSDIPLPNDAIYSIVSSTNSNSSSSTNNPYTWIPINKFSLNLINPVSSVINPYGVFGINYISELKFDSLSLNLQFQETSTFWFHRWCHDYIDAIFTKDDEFQGNSLNYYYQQISLQADILIWDSLDNIDEEQLKKFKKHIKSNLDHDIIIYDSGSFLRRWSLYVIPIIPKDLYSYQGTPKAELIQTYDMDFSIVGSSNLSFIQLK